MMGEEIEQFRSELEQNNLDKLITGTIMVLYTEELLERCYRQYCLNQIKHNTAFIKLEDFRLMFEDLMKEVYKEEE